MNENENIEEDIMSMSFPSMSTQQTRKVCVIIFHVQHSLHCSHHQLLLWTHFFSFFLFPSLFFVVIHFWSEKRFIILITFYVIWWSKVGVERNVNKFLKSLVPNVSWVVRNLTFIKFNKLLHDQPFNTNFPPLRCYLNHLMASINFFFFSFLSFSLERLSKIICITK